MMRRIVRIGLALWLCLIVLPARPAVAWSSLLAELNSNRVIASTVPGNGDVNPYGVAVVPCTVGKLVRGNILVSNFNNSDNLQGTGSTIVQIAPNGAFTTFATITAADLGVATPGGGVGLTMALVVLRSGWVIVGSLPTVDGTTNTAARGLLIILNSQGQVVRTLVGDPINGPWGMTAYDGGFWAALFVTNVLNCTVADAPREVDEGTVVRITLWLHEDCPPIELERTVIASGFGEQGDPQALVIGPTGVALARDGTLYVADPLASRIAAISHALFRSKSAGTGCTVSQSGFLNGPLGLAIAPNGNIIVANGGDGNLVEVTPHGEQVGIRTVDRTMTGAGSLFGLAIISRPPGIYYVNDADNTLNLLTRVTPTPTDDAD